jgi:hypothetical protein
MVSLVILAEVPMKKIAVKSVESVAFLNSIWLRLPVALRYKQGPTNSIIQGDFLA